MIQFIESHQEYILLSIACWVCFACGYLFRGSLNKLIEKPTKKS